MTALTLGDVLREHGGSIKTGPFGTTLKATEYVVEGAPVISVGEVGYGSLRLHGKTPRVGPETISRLAEYVLRAGDVVFGRKGAVDRSAWVKPHEDGYFLGSDGIRLRFDGDVDSRFMAYQLQSADVRDWLLQHAAGTTMLSLNQPTIERIPVTLPSLAEQRGITEVLGALDDKIAANTKSVNLSLELADTEFSKQMRAAVPGRTFGELATVGGGGTPRTSNEDYWNGNVSWATPTDITALSAPYLTTTARLISDEGLANCSSSLYPAGSILMTSRATIGAFALAQKPTAVNQGFIVVNANDPALQIWLFHEMRSRVPEFISHANGATFLELSRGKFKAFPVRVAELRVMADFGVFAHALHEQAAVLTAESGRLAATRDALLPLLMSGRVTVRDAESVVGEVL